METLKKKSKKKTSSKKASKHICTLSDIDGASSANEPTPSSSTSTASQVGSKYLHSDESCNISNEGIHIQELEQVQDLQCNENETVCHDMHENTTISQNRKEGAHHVKDLENFSVLKENEKVLDADIKTQDNEPRDISEVSAVLDDAAKLISIKNEQIIENDTLAELDETKDDNQKGEQSVVDTCLKPTAPPDMENTSTHLLYPDLSKLRLAENIELAQSESKLHEKVIKQSLKQSNMLYLACLCESNGISLDGYHEYLNQLEDEFVATQHPNIGATDPIYGAELYHNLQRYCLAYHKYREVLVDCKLNLDKVSDMRKKCWQFQTQTFSASGNCADGRLVKATHESEIAVPNLMAEKDMKNTIARMLESNVEKEKEAFMALKHSQYMVEKCISDPPNSNEDLAQSWRWKLQIIGNALRKAMINRCDEGDACEYAMDLQNWFEFIGVKLASTGNLNDRLWLMFHLLRFRKAISSWADDLVYAVEPFYYLTSLSNGRTFSNDELNSVLTMTLALFRPIKDRQIFVTSFEECHEEAANASENSSARKPTKIDDAFEWVDSDGEENALDKDVPPIKEVDLLAFLKRIPFSQVFEAITMWATTKDSNYELIPLHSSGMLRLIAFANKLIKIFGVGLKTYSDRSRYRQFSKYLALLINDTVQFVNDAFCIFLKHHEPSAAKEVGLVQVNFDILVHLAARNVYDRGSILSCYLSMLPFTLLSSRAVWWMFYSLLYRNFNLLPNDDLCSPEPPMPVDRFIDEWRNETPSDLLNMLKPFIDLALAHNPSIDHEFINTVVKTLFLLLQSTDATNVAFSDVVMNEIHTIVEREIFVVSAMLQCLMSDDPTKTQSLASSWQLKDSTLLTVFTFRNNDIRQWHPTEKDITVLLYMLENYRNSHIYHKLAVGLLMHIKYDKNSLFELNVPQRLQQQIVRSVVIAFRKNKLGPEANETEKDEFKKYRQRCLILLVQLRVHAMAQPRTSAYHLIHNSSDVLLRNIPSVDDWIEIKMGVAEQCPVSYVAALLTTTCGHWIPVICQKGFAMLEHLLELGLNSIALRCLEPMMLVFVESPSALYGNEQFMKLFRKLVQTDELLSMHTAKFGNLSTAAVLNKSKIGNLGAMLISQAASFWYSGFETPAILINMWIKCLGKLSEWLNDAKVLRLLDAAASVSFGYSDAWNAMRVNLLPLFETFASVKQKIPILHLMWAKYSGVEIVMFHSHLPSDCIALAMLVFEIEHQHVELDTGIWHHLLNVLNTNESITLEAAVKACNEIDFFRKNSFQLSTDTLVLFKLARFLIRAHFEHPFYLLLCQQFFTILLSRVTDPNNKVHGVSNRFYQANVELMGNLKSILWDIEKHCGRGGGENAANTANAANVANDATNAANADETTNASRRLSLVKAFRLWLVDYELNRLTVHDTNRLPVEYDVPHLQAVLQGSKEYWHACVDKNMMLDIHRTIVDCWRDSFCRQTFQKNVTRCDPPNETYSAVMNIDYRLAKLNNMYQPFRGSKSVLTHDAEDLRRSLVKPPMLRVKQIKEGLRVLKLDVDKTHRTTKRELDERGSELSHLFNKLYVNQDKDIVKHVKCNMLYCSGAATITIPTKSAIIDTDIEQHINSRISDLRDLLNLFINIPPYIIYHAIFVRELWSSLLTDCCEETNRRKADALYMANRKLLHTLLHELTETNFVPPLTFAVRLSLYTFQNEFSTLMFGEVSQMFGDSLNQGEKPSNIIISLLADPRIPPQSLIYVYNQLVKQTYGNLERCLFTEMFSSKLDIAKWVKEHDLVPEEVDQFAKLIIIGLLKTRTTDLDGSSPTDGQEMKEELISNMLLSHMVIFATNGFSENFGKMVQHTLNAYSQWPTLPNMMLLRLLNALRSRASVPDLDLGMDDLQLRIENQQFADANCMHPSSVLNFHELECLLVATTEHFMRLRDGTLPWNGMYKRHNPYVEVLGMFFVTISDAYVALGVTDQEISYDTLMPAIYRMFEPWIVPFDPEVRVGYMSYSQNQSSSSSNSVALPEKSTYSNNQKMKWMFNMFLSTIEYAVDKTILRYADVEHPSRILLNFFNWYLDWFGDPRIMISVLLTLNQLVLNLPWERLYPSEILIERMHAMLEYHSPVCHEFLAHIFTRCLWIESAENESPEPSPAWLIKTQAPTFAVCVRLAYEPAVRSDGKCQEAMIRIIKHFTNLKWSSMHVAEVIPALDWFVMTAQSSIMLRNPKAKQRKLDEALLEYLEIVVGMRFNDANPFVAGFDHLAKRKFYISVAARMLMNVGRGSYTVSSAGAVRVQLANAIQQLLKSIMSVISMLSLKDANEGIRQHSTEAHEMVNELIVSVNKWQTENGLSVFVDEFIRLLECEADFQLPVQCVLEAVTRLENISPSFLRLIESVLFIYFQHKPNEVENPDATGNRKATWLQVMEIVGKSVTRKWSCDNLVSNRLPLCLQLCFLHRWHESRHDNAAHLQFVEELLMILPELKFAEITECRLYPLWCTLLYTLFTINAIPDATIRKAIGLFGTVSENNPFWVVGMFKKILGKDKGSEQISITRSVIANAFAALLAGGYSYRSPDVSELDDYSIPTGTESFTIDKLLTAPEKRTSNARIASTAVNNFTSTCNNSCHKSLHGQILNIIKTFAEGEEARLILQRALEIVVVLDSNSNAFLSSLQEALLE